MKRRGANGRSSIPRLLAIGSLLATLVLLICGSAALADFGPIEIQSVGALDQFAEADETAMSSDGAYLAMQGTLNGVMGIYRKNIASGQLELVAGGNVYEPAGGAPTNASAPSISENGRYVSFTTTAPLVAQAHAGGNVYVRDLNRSLPSTANGACTPEEEASATCAYELASALNGSNEGLTYYSGDGASATGRVSISADGREVAFVVSGESNLTSEAGGSTPGVHTPGSQVAVRYLDSKRTVLVSTEREPNTGRMTEMPVPGGAVATEFVVGSNAQLPGAALSADGSTVAWLGAHIPAQTPTLGDEAQAIDSDDASGNEEAYDEPLWRRIADGPGAPTRRIVGGGDPLAPGCPSTGTLNMSACRGPFPELDTDTRGGEENHTGWLGIPGYDAVPQLSADGQTVALIGDPSGTSNVFVVNMAEGLDRVEAVRQLTREIPVFGVINPANLPQYIPTAGDVFDIAISPNGQRIAFTTAREQFPLAPPNMLEAPLNQVGVAELYEIDLKLETLARVTHGPAGAPSRNPHEQIRGTGAWSPSLDGDGNLVAFSSTASNLVIGDTNEESDAFTVLQTESAKPPGAIEVDTAPSWPPPLKKWSLSVVANAHHDGSVTVDVDVPGSGTVTASESATIPVAVRTPHGHPRAKRTKLTRRTVASAHARVAVAGLTTIPLRVSRPYASLLSSKAGLYVTLKVSFASSEGRPLSQTLTLSLHAAKQKKKKKKKKKKKISKPHKAPKR